jgi:hypothetical protein
MTPAEAAAIELEEPDWGVEFERECARWPRLPRYLQEDCAFEEVLRRWRRFHWSPVDVDGKAMKRPASATEAMIALAKLRILPPRSTWVDIPHGDIVEGFQQDDHVWLSYSGEQWRIVGVEDRMLHLARMTFDGKEPEQKSIDLGRAHWDRYIESAVAVLEAQRSG